MNKITKIELEDIRIYKEKEEFNFLYNDTEVANLITIYGPNGFGKSSFFDACEWAMSGIIKRFENDKESQELLNQHDLSLKDKVFLNNRDSYRLKNDFTGYVKFFINGIQEPSGRTIKERAKRGQGYKEDYKTGDFFGENEKMFTKTSENKLLSQTMIDAFLRSDTPEKRFEIISAMIPKLNQTVDIYNNLKKYYRVLADEKKEIEEGINELKTKQTTLLNVLPNIEDINSLIRKYIHFELFNSELNIISAEISQTEYDNLNSLINKNKIQLENLLEKNEKEIINLTSLIDQFTEFESWEKNHDKIILEIDEINKLIKLHIDFKEHEKEINDLEKKITELKSILNDYIELQKLHKFYIEFKEKISQNKQLESKERENINNLNRTISDLSNQIAELINRKSNLVLEKEYFEEQIKEHKFKLQRRKEISLELDKLKKEIIPLSNNVRDLKKNIENFQLKKNQFEIILKDFTISENFQVSDDIKILIKKRKQQIEEIEKIKREIESKELDYKKAGSLNENLNRIILWGLDIIKETKTTNCPLCNFHYENVDDILAHINSEKEDLLNIFGKENLLKQLMNVLNEIEEAQKKTENNIRELVSNEINILTNKIIELKDNKDKVDNIVNEKTKNIERGRNDLDEIGNFLEKYITNLPYDEDEQGNKFGQLPDLMKELEKVEKQIKENEKRKIDLETSISKSNGVIVDLKNQTQSIEQDEKYLKANLLSQKYEKDDVFEHINKIRNLINEKNLMINEIFTKIRIHKEINEQIKTELEAKIHFGQEHELKGNLQERDAEINILKSKILTYQNNFQKATNKHEFLYSNLEAELETKKTTISKHADALKVTNELILEVKVLDNLVKFNEVNSNIEHETLKLYKTNIAFLKFETAFKDCQNVIEDVVAKQLNRETINNIYKRIEPHPELNEIDFQIYFSDSGKPLLKIISKSEKEEIDPTLFLSSGQINVLSLSIFLAKALHDKDGLDAIFMDDPVQNLSDINILSFIDLIRTLISKGDKQIIISTHDENFLNLLKNKLPENHYKSKYLELVSYGKLKN
jgi:DNA repair protein SbcC/Rad50